MVNLDTFSLTDPFCEVYIRENKNDQWEYIGVTETQQDTLDPDFIESFKINYYFNRTQFLRFEVFDKDTNN